MSQPKVSFRPPAVPLVTHDPYFSVWSPGDALPDVWPTHWTGTPNHLCGLLRVDGVAYRFASPVPGHIPAVKQQSLTVLPTTTVYEFEAGAIHLQVSFLSPLLPDDLDLLSRPVTYITCVARALDGKRHAVSVYLDVTGHWVTDSMGQKVVWARHQIQGLRVLRMGSLAQPVLEKSGDNLRIDWGYLYLAAPQTCAGATALASADVCRAAFIAKGQLPVDDDLELPRTVSHNWPVLALTLELGQVGRSGAEGWLMLAYDDLFSVEYFHRRLRPYWRRPGWEMGDLLRAATADYDRVRARCRRFDARLMSELRRAGGEKYARLCALAFRQCIAAHKLAVDFDGTPVFFSKENFSNGCIDTVDVTYPSSPFFLLFNPELLKAQLTPILEYARSPHWKFPFAPHDLGTYPLANGQVYGGGEMTEENQMPVEESGNLLILLGALAHIEGNADFAAHYWPQLTRWAEYLSAKGMDPENQLSTDDFAGHLAHNTNLSIKAILGLRSFSELARLSGKPDVAARYLELAGQMAAKWPQMAADGDHYKLAFDRAGTWSQKYNLVWDRLLGYNLFAPEIARQETAFYLTKLNTYGLPLDNRKTYTKLDWIVWTACLAEKDEDFRRIVSPSYRWMNATPTRVPLTDWYETTDGKQVGFQARSVVGGLFIPLLRDPALWKKWAARAERTARQ